MDRDSETQLEYLGALGVNKLPQCFNIGEWSLLIQVIQFMFTFRCSMCRGSLTTWYKEKDDQLYCKEDYLAVYGENCSNCSDVITGPIMVSIITRYTVILLYKATWQYLLACIVSRYCLLSLHSSIM